MFLLNIKNTSNFVPNIKNQRFVTNKEEKDKHGWGIESVKCIVKKYNGYISFKYDEKFLKYPLLLTNSLFYKGELWRFEK